MGQAGFAGEQFLHHALLDEAGLVAAGFEGGEVGVEGGEDLGDGALFGEGRDEGTSLSSVLEML